ncbi:MAG TPA: hypothetical protein VFI73_14170 [Candidatus Nitrosopolaris sp.]|nr:hypothetical protein [Candidatus Nitrosopolaris sp.]
MTKNLRLMTLFFGLTTALLTTIWLLEQPEVYATQGANGTTANGANGLKGANWANGTSANGANGTSGPTVAKSGIFS